ncbi:MAG: glycosyltransferase [Rhizomicrobium sp.]
MNLRENNPFARALRWKRQTDIVLAELLAANEGLKSDLNQLREEKRALETRLRLLEKRGHSISRAVRNIFSRLWGGETPAWSYFAPEMRQSFVLRDGRIRMLSYLPRAEERFPIGSNLGDQITDALLAGTVTAFEAARIDANGYRFEWEPLPSLLSEMRQSPDLFGQIFLACEKANDDLKRSETGASYFQRVKDIVLRDPDLAEFAANAQQFYVTDREDLAHEQLAFLHLDWRPLHHVPAQPKRRSAVFLHHSYYHFGHVAAALRKRGWDAITVSVESPESPQRQFYHGEDINLFDADPARMRERVAEFFKTVPERFGALQFYGRGQPSFFPENFENRQYNSKMPWDFLELRRHRLVIGYSPSGCLDESLQTSIHRVTGGLCDRCIWQTRPDVCSDAMNAAWKEKIEMLCDWVALEGDWLTPDTSGPKFVRGPAIMALDPEQWSPDIEVPERFRLDRGDGELLVYHAVGNYLARRQDSRDIKGTGAVLAAIERLKAEGVPVRLFFATDIPSRDVRFYQVQADVVVDQLNYGRLGANARESLMLGRPLITNINAGKSAPLQYVLETPAVHATEETVYAELKALLADGERRRMLARAGREFALKWHASDVCAGRFENIIDRVSQGLPPEERGPDGLDIAKQRC